MGRIRGSGRGHRQSYIAEKFFSSFAFSSAAGGRLDGFHCGLLRTTRRGENTPSAHDWAMQEALAQAYDHLVGPEEKLTEEEAFGFLTAQAEALFGGPASRQAIIIVPSPKAFLS